MWRQKDDLADKLIANNAARPIPGMEKPDLERMTLNGVLPRPKAIPPDDGTPHGE